jgi:hypothetical protein
VVRKKGNRGRAEGREEVERKKGKRGSGKEEREERERGKENGCFAFSVNVPQPNVFLTP